MHAASKFITSNSDEINNTFRNELSVQVKISEAKPGMTIMFPADSEDENEELNEEWALTSDWVFAEVVEKNNENATIQILGYLHEPEHEKYATGSEVRINNPLAMVGPKGGNQIYSKNKREELHSSTRVDLEKRLRIEDIRADTEGKDIINECAKLSKSVSLFGIPDLDKIPRDCSLKKEVKRMIVVGGLVRFLHWKRFERLVDDLEFNKRDMQIKADDYQTIRNSNRWQN